MASRPPPQKLRRAFNLPNHAHELTFTSFHGMHLLSKDRTRQWFIEAMEVSRRELNFEIWAYVIMPNHAHILINSLHPEYKIEDVLKSIKQPVARRATNFLRIAAPDFLAQLEVVRPSGRIEHRFWQQGGGYDRNMISRDAIESSIDYLHNNPVRKNLVLSAFDWEWSSARHYANFPDVKLVPDKPSLS